MEFDFPYKIELVNQNYYGMQVLERPTTMNYIHLSSSIMTFLIGTMLM